MGKKGGGKGGKAAPAPDFAAADEDDVEALTAALAADPGALASRNADGWTPLHAAAYAGSVECVSALLAAGADAKAACKDGDLPVHYAAAQGHVEAARALVAAAGAGTLAATDNDGETPLDVAQSAKVRRALEKMAEDAEAADGGADEGDGEGGEDGEGDGE